MTQTTHFGFKEVPVEEKKHRVREVFDSVAPNYDLMNDFMSGGIHRLWKKQAIHLCQLREGDQVLDLASGTGDLAKKMAKIVGKKGQVILSDINHAMLSEGQKRMIDAGLSHNTRCVVADAEDLPFLDDQFDCVTIAFGLRNVTDKQKALESMHRVLKPGGKLVVLEFSKPVAPGLNPIYDTYSFKILPKIGKWVAKDEDSYQYLAESIRKHPPQEELKAMLEDAGFFKAEYFNLTGGIVAIHRGYKVS
mgnify:CR=1 FL=1